MGASWVGKKSSWDQDDGLFSFKIKSVFGEGCLEGGNLALSSVQLLGAKKHPPGTQPCARGGACFPEDFNSCPYCGEKLVAAPPDVSPLWIPPYGAGNGLKIFPKGLAPGSLVKDLGVSFPMPPLGERFSFITSRMGAEQRVLLALERTSGRFFVYNSDTFGWRELGGRLAPDNLPAWAWSVAVDHAESGVCIPDGTGPVWVTINWAKNRVDLDRAQGESVGGAVRMGNHVLVPVLRDGLFAMLARKDGAGQWFDCFALGDPKRVLKQLHREPNQDRRNEDQARHRTDQERRNPDQEAYLGIPVVDETRSVVFWPARGGYVKVAGFDSQEGPSWIFKTWETGENPSTALIELGPPLRMPKKSGFWQLCEDKDNSRDGIVYKVIKFDGDEVTDSEEISCGQFLTTGRASFSWTEDRWVDIRQRNSLADDQEGLRFPVLQFGDQDKGLVLVAKASWDDTDAALADELFSSLFFNRALRTMARVRFVIEGAETPEKALSIEGKDEFPDGNGSVFRVSLANLPELTAFTYSDSLFLYFPEKNECFRWPMELLGS